MEQNQSSTEDVPVDEATQTISERSVDKEHIDQMPVEVKEEAIEQPSLGSEPPVVQNEVVISEEKKMVDDLYEDSGKEIVKKEHVDDRNSTIEEGELLSENPVEDGQIDIQKNEEQCKPEPGAAEPVLDQTPVDPKLRKLFVGGLHYDADDAVLREFYSSFGDIEEVFIARHPVTHHSRGYAFVTFTTRDAVDAVINSRPHQLMDKNLTEKRATPKESGMAIDTKALYIAGISEHTTEEQLKEYFSRYGEIENIKIHMNDVTQKPRGFGFINFMENDAVDQCVLDKLYHVVAGVEIKASKAIPRDAQKCRDRNNRFCRSRGYNRNPQNMGYFNPGNNSRGAPGFEGWGYTQKQQQAAPGWMMPPKNFGQAAAFPGSSHSLVNQNLAYRASAGAETSSSSADAPPFMKAYYEAMATNTLYPPFFPPPPRPGANDF